MALVRVNTGFNVENGLEPSDSPAFRMGPYLWLGYPHVLDSSPNPDGHSGVKCRGSCLQTGGASHRQVAVTFCKGFLMLKNEKQSKKEAEQLPIWVIQKKPCRGQRLQTGLKRLLDLSALPPTSHSLAPAKDTLYLSSLIISSFTSFLSLLLSLNYISLHLISFHFLLPPLFKN